MALAVPSLVGGVLGSLLVLWLPERVFAAVVPWLIVFACVLLALQGPLKRLLARVPGSDHPAAAWFIQLAVAIYGGYFGAGMGILMLAAMGILLKSSLQHANGLKVLFSFLINGVAALIFLGAGAARLPEAALMAVAAGLGGWGGAHLAQRLPPAAHALGGHRRRALRRGGACSGGTRAPGRRGPGSDPQEGLADVVVAEQVGAGAGEDHAPGLQHVGPGGDLERLVDVLLDQQDGGPLRC